MIQTAFPGVERQRTCPFTVLIDHREQLPYSFADLPPKASWRGRLYVPTERTHLVTGDYTIRGLEERFALERKSLSDLFSTIGQHRDRFEAELERLNAMDFAAVVVEADLREMWNPAVARWRWAIQRLLEVCPYRVNTALVRLAAWLANHSSEKEWRSQLKPRSVEGSVVAWSIRYPRVHWWHVGDRVAGEVRAFEAMEQFWRLTCAKEKQQAEAGAA